MFISRLVFIYVSYHIDTTVKFCQTPTLCCGQRCLTKATCHVDMGTIQHEQWWHSTWCQDIDTGQCLHQSSPLSIHRHIFAQLSLVFICHSHCLFLFTMAPPRIHGAGKFPGLSFFKTVFSLDKARSNSSHSLHMGSRRVYYTYLSGGVDRGRFQHMDISIVWYPYILGCLPWWNRKVCDQTTNWSPLLHHWLDNRQWPIFTKVYYVNISTQIM